MFDTELLERVMSVFLHVSAFLLWFVGPMAFVLPFGLLAARGPEQFAIVGVVLLLSLVPSFFVAIGLVWLMKRSRNGRGGAFLEPVAAALDAEVSQGSMLWPLLQPRLIRREGKHPFRFVLQLSLIHI